MVVCVIIQFDLAENEHLRNENHHLRAESKQYPPVKLEVKEPVKPEIKIEPGKCLCTHTQGRAKLDFVKHAR